MHIRGEIRLSIYTAYLQQWVNVYLEREDNNRNGKRRKRGGIRSGLYTVGVRTIWIVKDRTNWLEMEIVSGARKLLETLYGWPLSGLKDAVGLIGLFFDCYGSPI